MSGEKQHETLNPNRRTKHDELFKKLMELFFEDFIAVFFPKLYPLIDFQELTFLQQEVISDIVGESKRYVDILVKTRLKNSGQLILIHVEHQAQFQTNFSERVYVYSADLYKRYRIPVLSIAVFSYDEIHNEPDTFSLNIGHINLVALNFFTLELKKQNWKEYIQANNPASCTLLCKMGYSGNEKVEVKIEFFRMLTRLKLDPARESFIIGFFETYHKMDSEQEAEFWAAVKKLKPEESEAIMEITVSWYRQGEVNGKAKLLLKLLAKRFGAVPPATEEKLLKQSSEKLDEIGEALFELSSAEELNALLH